MIAFLHVSIIEFLVNSNHSIQLILFPLFFVQGKVHVLLHRLTAVGLF